MPLRSILVVLFRLYAIYWLVEGVEASLVMIPLALKEHPMMYAFLIAVPILVVVPALIWRFAFLLAEIVSRDFNPQIELKGLDRHDLYCFAFVFVGLWFCLLSLSGMIHSGYLYVDGLATNPDNTADLNTHLRYFSAHFVTFAAGIACVLGANSLSKKIARFDTPSS